MSFTLLRMWQLESLTQACVTRIKKQMVAMLRSAAHRLPHLQTFEGFENRPGHWNPAAENTEHPDFACVCFLTRETITNVFVMTHKLSFIESKINSFATKNPSIFKESKEHREDELYEARDPSCLRCSSCPWQRSSV